MKKIVKFRVGGLLKVFLTSVICISSLDHDVIALVVTIKRCQNLLKRVQIKLIAIHPNFLQVLD